MVFFLRIFVLLLWLPKRTHKAICFDWHAEHQFLTDAGRVYRMARDSNMYSKYCRNGRITAFPSTSLMLARYAASTKYVQIMFGRSIIVSVFLLRCATHLSFGWTAIVLCPMAVEILLESLFHPATDGDILFSWMFITMARKSIIIPSFARARRIHMVRTYFGSGAVTSSSGFCPPATTLL